MVPRHLTSNDKRYREEVLHLPGLLDKWLAQLQKLPKPRISRHGVSGLHLLLHQLDLSYQHSGKVTTGRDGGARWDHGKGTCLLVLP